VHRGPFEEEEGIAEVRDQPYVLSLSIPDEFMDQVRHRARQDKVSLAQLVATIAADADPLAGPRGTVYIQKLAGETGIDITGRPDAVFVLEVYLRRTVFPPRDFMRDVASELPAGATEVLAGRLFVTCHVHWLRRDFTLAALGEAWRPDRRYIRWLRRGLAEEHEYALLPEFDPSRPGLVEAASAVAGALVGTSADWVDPGTLALLVLGAHDGGITKAIQEAVDRHEPDSLWRLFPPVDLAKDLDSALRKLAWDRYAVVHELWARWRKGVLAVFCALGRKAGER
jgi:hypothetical protein